MLKSRTTFRQLPRQLNFTHHDHSIDPLPATRRHEILLEVSYHKADVSPGQIVYRPMTRFLSPPAYLLPPSTDLRTSLSLPNVCPLSTTQMKSSYLSHSFHSLPHPHPRTPVPLSKPLKTIKRSLRSKDTRGNPCQSRPGSGLMVFRARSDSKYPRSTPPVSVLSRNSTSYILATTILHFLR